MLRKTGHFTCHEHGFGYGYKIDFTKPGAQGYINSIIDLYASWGIDFIKMGSVTPGSYLGRRLH